MQSNPREHLIKLIQLINCVLVVIFAKSFIPQFWFVDNITSIDKLLNQDENFINYNQNFFNYDLNKYLVNIVFNIFFLMFGLFAVVLRSELSLIVFLILLPLINAYSISSIGSIYLSIMISSLCIFIVAFGRHPKFMSSLSYDQRRRKSTVFVIDSSVV